MDRRIRDHDDSRDHDAVVRGTRRRQQRHRDRRDCACNRRHRLGVLRGVSQRDVAVDRALSTVWQLVGTGLESRQRGCADHPVFMLYCFALPANGLLHWKFLPDHVLFGLDASNLRAQPPGFPVRSPPCGCSLFSMPLFLFTPDQTGTGVTARQAVRDGLADVWRTVRQLRHYKNVALNFSACACCSTTARSQS